MNPKRVIYRIEIEVYDDGDMQWVYSGKEDRLPEHIKRIVGRMRQVYKFLQGQVRSGRNEFLMMPEPKEAPGERVLH
jgi:hypothetical protein